MTSSKTQRDPVHSFQTVRLTRGSHSRPADGVCVMELASMIAGESFGDHPRSVSPVIASFMRVYNDCVDDERRQDLYRYAAEAVGTRTWRQTERTRAALCELWLAVHAELPPIGQRFAPVRRGQTLAAKAAEFAADSPARHRAALALLDALIEASPADGPSGKPDDTSDARAVATSTG